MEFLVQYAIEGKENDYEMEIILYSNNEKL